MSEKEDNLFDNDMVRKAKKTLSKEYQDQLKKQGEKIHEFDFANIAGAENNAPEKVDEIVEQIKMMIKSGMHISYLSSDEKYFLECKLGENWYEHFGYMKNDVNRINL
jgi:hypothetical protein